MPSYRRAFQPGRTFFLTIVTYRRRKLFGEAANVQRLREAVRRVRFERPFEATAGVALPDHLHLIWDAAAGRATPTSPGASRG